MAKTRIKRLAVFELGPREAGQLIHAEVLHGKALSYNNLADADAALSLIKEFRTDPACVILKHANPCGAAISADQLTAYQAAFACDSTSAFGGIIAFNQILEEQAAEAIIKQQFAEVIIAPDFTDNALAILKQKKNVRLLKTGSWPEHPKPAWQTRSISGGLLIQNENPLTLIEADCKVVTEVHPDDAAWQDLKFAWAVVKHIKSNAIVYVQNQATIGVGAGQMSRIFSAEIAALKAKSANLNLTGSAMASDAFFPFRDGIDLAAKQGVRAIIQPGGSIRDEEVIQAANEAGIAMVFTGLRHFYH